MNPLMTTGPSPSDRQRGHTALSVNLNKVALLRNTRSLGDPERGACGAAGDSRPVPTASRCIRVPTSATSGPAMCTIWRSCSRSTASAEFNIEGNPFHNLMPLVRELAAAGRCPQQVTFVPDSVEQSTSDHGWQLPPMPRDWRRWWPKRARSVRASACSWIPTRPRWPRCAGIGADRVELYTEAYARAHGAAGQARAARHLCRRGPGCDRRRSRRQRRPRSESRQPEPISCGAVPGVQEVSIGHALIADAIELGLAQTVREYLLCIRRAASAADRT